VEQLNALDPTAVERHLRCLGLAILLSNAAAVGTPLIILDDAINAIAALLQFESGSHAGEIPIYMADDIFKQRLG
jgi:hypothetical protein